MKSTHPYIPSPTHNALTTEGTDYAQILREHHDQRFKRRLSGAGLQVERGQHQGVFLAQNQQILFLRNAIESIAIVEGQLVLPDTLKGGRRGKDQ